MSRSTVAALFLISPYMIISVVFLYMWHIRTMARDRMVSENTKMLAMALKDCQDSRPRQT